MSGYFVIVMEKEASILVKAWVPELGFQLPELREIKSRLSKLASCRHSAVMVPDEPSQILSPSAMWSGQVWVGSVNRKLLKEASLLFPSSVSVLTLLYLLLNFLILFCQQLSQRDSGKHLYKF